VSPRGRADYGIDAPPVVAGALAGALVATGTGLYFWLVSDATGFIPDVLEEAVWVGLGLFVFAAVMVWSSKVGKRRLARSLLAEIPWRGDERVLDVGCGRGLLLVEAAGHLTAGRAVGVDVWSRKDQSGNSPETTLRNAELEGIRHRLDVVTGDATNLPFPDGAFDVVLSGLVLHNIADRQRRRTAVREIARVLGPGGRLVVVDILHTEEYMHELEAAGAANVRRSGMQPLFLLPTTRAVTATK
jgi:SAM-dependent methyltransferase